MSNELIKNIKKYNDIVLDNELILDEKIIELKKLVQKFIKGVFIKIFRFDGKTYIEIISKSENGVSLTKEFIKFIQELDNNYKIQVMSEIENKIMQKKQGWMKPDLADIEPHTKTIITIIIGDDDENK